MPTYEYRCKDCGHTFDAYQSFTEDALTECPSCAGTVKKVFGNVGIAFKGSGFYKTDSRGGAKPAAAKTDSSTTSDSSSSSSSDAPAKADTKKSDSTSTSSSSSTSTPAATKS
jgi:putative FmdB family regulatory protein